MSRSPALSLATELLSDIARHFSTPVLVVLLLKSLAAGFLSSLLGPCLFQPKEGGSQSRHPEAGEPGSRGLSAFLPRPPGCGLRHASLFFFERRSYFPAKSSKISSQLNWFRGS